MIARALINKVGHNFNSPNLSIKSDIYLFLWCTIAPPVSYSLPSFRVAVAILPPTSLPSYISILTKCWNVSLRKYAQDVPPIPPPIIATKRSNNAIVSNQVLTLLNYLPIFKPAWRVSCSSMSDNTNTSSRYFISSVVKRTALRQRLLPRNDGLMRSQLMKILPDGSGCTMGIFFLLICYDCIGQFDNYDFCSSNSSIRYCTQFFMLTL